MNAYRAYHQHEDVPLPRIDSILLLYERALKLLDRARQALTSQPAEVQLLLVQVQMMIGGISAGIDPATSDVAKNLHRLHSFVMQCLANPTDEHLSGAVEVLRMLQEGFQAIRTQALERNGQLPPLDSVTLEALA